MIIIWGDPKVDVTALVAGAAHEWVESLWDVTGDDEPKGATTVLLGMAKRGLTLYIASGCKPTSAERRVIDAVVQRVGDHWIVDESFELLRNSVVVEDDIVRCHNSEEFQSAYFKALELEGAADRVEFVDVPETLVTDPNDDMLAFCAADRRGSVHTINFVADGTIEVDGCVLRHSAIVAQGVYKNGLIAERVLTPQEVVGFVAIRMATHGPKDLVGYGRAFGPGRDDHTNAHLTPRARAFRAGGIVGVVIATSDRVAKARPEMVMATAWSLYKGDGVPTWVHQQNREIYRGPAAVDGFRAVVDGDSYTVGGKSTKALGVDVRAYNCHTTDGTGYVTLPAVMMVLDEANDGSVFAPKALMGRIDVFLKERVTATKDFRDMTDDLVSEYFSTAVLVSEGQTILPNEVVFTVGSGDRAIPHRWQTKATYGIVRKVVEVVTNDLVSVDIQIDAHFPGDAKMRGFGKGLVTPMEAVAMKSRVTVRGTTDRLPRMVIGINGIVKDSFAAVEYATNRKPATATITVGYCQRNYELRKAQYQPLEACGYEDGIWTHEQDSDGIRRTLIFSDSCATVTTIDYNAEVADVRFTVEAAPVAQSVGSSAMTLPQISMLSSLPTGAEWLEKHALPGIYGRTNALGYMHAVTNQILRELAPGHDKAIDVVLGEMALDIQNLSGLTDESVIKVVAKAYGRGVNVGGVNSGAVWINPLELMSLGHADGFGLEMIGMAHTAADLLRAAADVEYADKLGHKGCDRLIRMYVAEAKTRADSKRVNQIHAFRWGSGAKVAVGNNVEPGTIRIKPGGQYDRQAAQMFGMKPGTLDRLHTLVLRHPFVMGYVAQIVYDVNVTDNLIIANVLDWRKATKGDSDGDTAAVFPIPDVLMAIQLAIELTGIAANYDATLAIRGIAAHDPAAEMWGEGNKALATKMAMSFTETFTKGLQRHEKMGNFANLWTPYAYRISDVCGLMAALGYPGAREASLAGAVIEEDYFLGLNIDGTPPELTIALDAWFNSTIDKKSATVILTGLRKAINPAVVNNEDFRVALFDGARINRRLFDRSSPIGSITHFGWLVGKGRTTTTADARESIDALSRIFGDELRDELSSDIRKSLLGRIAFYAQGKLKQFVREPRITDEGPGFDPWADLDEEVDYTGASYI